MVSSTKSAGTPSLNAEEGAPGTLQATASAAGPLVQGASPSHLQLARRAAGDIADCVMVLAEYQFIDVSPPVLQMVQQRVHALASSIFEVLDERPRPVEVMRSELYPSEPAHIEQARNEVLQ